MVDHVASIPRHTSDYEEPKKQRTKAYEWLLSTDHQLFVCTNRRRSFWCFPDAQARPPWPELPTLSISIDQGSDGWCVVHYLAYHCKAAIVLLKALNHRLWNDAWGALGQAGTRPLMVLAIVVLSADHGPWADARWLQQAREAAVAYCKVGDIDDALFQKCFHQMVEDMDLQDRMNDASLPSEVFASVAEAADKMTDKVATSRWFGLFNTLRSFKRFWTRRYLLLAYLGHELGLYGPQDLGNLLTKRVRVTEGDDDGTSRGVAGTGGPTAADNVDVAALRKAAKNTMHLSCAFLGDPGVKRTLLGITSIVEPLQEGFRWQNVSARPVEGALRVYVDYSQKASMAAEPSSRSPSASPTTRSSSSSACTTAAGLPLV